MKEHVDTTEEVRTALIESMRTFMGEKVPSVVKHHGYMEDFHNMQQ